MGAKPFTFLDYVANERLEPKVMQEIVGGMARACKEAGVAIVGGETAEMPGTYAKGEHDIAGCITGIVERSEIITGEKIKAGDLILGLPSSGLHTNGFSLARKLLFDIAKYNVKTKLPELGHAKERAGMTVGNALLKVHTNYAPFVISLLDKEIKINGIAHITGGGFIENIPRVLPKNLDAEITLGSWPVLPIFSLLQKIGKVPMQDMYRTFNMGIGMALIVPEKEKQKIEKLLKGQKIHLIGKIIKGKGKVTFK
jgi:phosphoribosylformylglycinamidine cyclo-ligase